MAAKLTPSVLVAGSQAEKISRFSPGSFQTTVVGRTRGNPGSVTMKVKAGRDGATMLSRMKIIWIQRTCERCTFSSRVRVLGLGSGLDLMSAWIVIMHTYLYYFRLSLSHCQNFQPCPPKLSHYMLESV